MQLIQMFRNNSNPQAFAINFLKQNAGNNPIAQNAIEMISNGNFGNMESLARNLAKSKGIDIDSMYNEISKYFR